jgi:hypothetical protein
MAVEIELTRKRQIRRDFQVTGTAQNRIIPKGQKLNIDVILLDRFVAFVKALVFPPATNYCTLHRGIDSLCINAIMDYDVF